MKALEESVLPGMGKIAISYQGRKSQALLQLPSAATRAAMDDLEPSIWLTVGKLSETGLVAQVRPEELNAAVRTICSFIVRYLPFCKNECEPRGLQTGPVWILAA